MKRIVAAGDFMRFYTALLWAFVETLTSFEGILMVFLWTILLRVLLLTNFQANLLVCDTRE